MKFSHFFIDRPIFASVISILIVLVGGIAYFNLPVTQYPEIVPPSVVISANYSGARLQVAEGIVGHVSLVNQIERSATSIGANISEAQYAQSKSDFISKLYIALKECNETEYWLKLFVRAGIIAISQGEALLHDCGVMRRKLVHSINTAKGNL